LAALLEYVRQYQPTAIVPTKTDIESLLAGQKPFVLLFEEKFGFSISKPKLGVILGELILQNPATWDAVFHASPEASEIAQFLRFVMLW